MLESIDVVSIIYGFWSLPLYLIVNARSLKSNDPWFATLEIGHMQEAIIVCPGIVEIYRCEDSPRCKLNRGHWVLAIGTFLFENKIALDDISQATGWLMIAYKSAINVTFHPSVSLLDEKQLEA